MKDALQQTFYCDNGHPDIQTVAASLRSDEKDPVAITARTFYFVRDSVAFGFDLFQRKASDTLKRGYGACWNKSLLLTALLRSNQIPAQFGSIPVKRTFHQTSNWLLALVGQYPLQSLYCSCVREQSLDHLRCGTG